MKDTTDTYLLANGLRVLIMPAETDVVYAGIAVAAGTRHETDCESGMAHLVEHMSFKGTTKHSATQIINRMESVGGELNAYTGKEETIYYSTFMRAHLRRALPLLVEMVFNSTYPQEELEREVEVVADEIESYNDAPAELIYDDFEELLLPNHPLGRRILGEAERLRQYTSDDLHRFVNRQYCPDKAVLFVKGNVSRESVFNAVSSACGMAKATPLRINQTSSLIVPDSLLPFATPQTSIIHKEVHQAHVMIGAQAFSLQDSRYYGLFLLNNLLGGPAMSSRLNLALRERAGLVYTVGSDLTAYTDSGVWSVYFGCDAGDVKRCLRLVHQELKKLIDKPLSSRSLKVAKEQLKGQMGVGRNNFENVALSAAKQFLHYGYVRKPEEINASIDALTAEDLQAVAQDIFRPERLTTLVYLPKE
ncbi:MAG: insulinase family protein [Bacteroidaceae bacterium]|nr:insulinase family protein [Bacteroidaceae bacterium]